MTADTNLAVSSDDKLERAAKAKGLSRAVEQAQKALAKIEGRVLETPEDFALAGEQLLQAKEREKLVNDLKDENYLPLYREVTKIGKNYKAAADAWAEVWREISKQRHAYEKRLEAARKAREREIREAQEAEAKRAREEAERAAQEAEAKNDQAAAAELRAEASRPFIPIPVAPVKPPKTEGLSEQKTFKARVVDIDALAEEYVERKPLMSVLHGLARAAGKKYEGDEEMANKDAPAGVQFYADSTPVRKG